MAYRLYARRQTTGEWIHTNVPASLEFTPQLNDTGHAAGFIPRALDVETASDGKPMWMERGTTLYVEGPDGSLPFVGLCTFQRPTKAGRELEFAGLSSAYSLIGFDGRIKEWSPDPYTMVGRLVNNAHAQPDGDVGITVVRDGDPKGTAGDEQPPPRPPKVKRRRGETAEHFQDRQEARQDAQQAWDEEYGDREPYSVAWWEAPYVLEEIKELSAEIPFDWYTRHAWTDRPNLVAKHELVLTDRVGRQITDVKLQEGVNIAEVLDARTDFDAYGNHAVILGAGEGRRMKRAEVGTRDGRVRTTRYGEAKHVRNVTRLQKRATSKLKDMGIAVKLDQAAARSVLAGVGLGDEIKVESRLFTGWCRVYGITRSTTTGNVTLSFTDPGGGATE